jgi:uncharacterized protein YbjT (DUF2867 family)
VTDVLVAGATGRQGGSVVDHLLAGDAGEVTVHGLTRDAGREAARRLADRGVRLVEGDLTDRAAMDAAVAGMDGVYLVTAGDSADVERRQGTTGVEAAAAAGVDHVVLSSGGGADRRPGIPHVDAKADVEATLRSTAVDWTVLAPHSFASNLERQREAIRGGRLAFPLPEGAKLAIVDPDDVGRLAARAFARLTDDRPAPGSGVDGPDPGRLVGARVELAGDVLTLEGMADVFTDVLGRPVEPVHLPPDAVPEGMRAFLGWMAGLDVDRVPERLRERYGFEPRTLRDYLLRTGWGEDDGDREGTEPTPGSRRDGSGDPVR